LILIKSESGRERRGVKEREKERSLFVMSSVVCEREKERPLSLEGEIENA